MKRLFPSIKCRGRCLAVIVIALSSFAPLAMAQAVANIFGRSPTSTSSAFGRGVGGNSKVTVQVLQRDLDIPFPGGGTLARGIDDRFVHAQIVVRDENGKVIDLENIGYFGDDENGKNRGGSVRRENKAFSYDVTPRYEATVSYDDYYMAKQEARKRFEDAGKYDKWSFSPHTTGNVRDNPADRMSMAEFEANCQAFAEYFTERLNEKDSCVVKTAYVPPGSETGMGNRGNVTPLANDTVLRQETIAVSGGTGNSTAFSPVTGRAEAEKAVSISMAADSPSSQTPAFSSDIAAMAGQLANQVGSIQSRQHACTSFEFVKDYLDARKQPYQKLYRCTECGKETIVDARGGETIEDKIAQNKQRAAMTGQAYGFAQGALQAMPGAVAAQNGAGCATPDAGVADILNEHGLMAGSALLCTMTERGEGPLAHYNTQPTQENP